MRWIKCNLPWRFYGDGKDAPKRPNLNKEIKKVFGQTIEEAQKAATRLLNNKKEMKKYAAFCDKVRTWQTAHPLMKAYREALDKYYEEQKLKSFCGKNLNKSGTLIEVLHNDKLYQYLIGDINTIAGVCDDCTAFDENAVVVRYKILLDKPKFRSKLEQ